VRLHKPEGLVRYAGKGLTPGGLESASGWRSTLYRTLDEKLFVDELSYRGKVFAVRYAERNGDRWDRYTAYKNRDAEPPGYRQPTSKQCAECHAKLGEIISMR
jgi:hypothetical protein